VVNVVYAFFDTFGIIHQVTEGGPAGATNILVYKVFHDGFLALDLGGADGDRDRAHRGPVPLSREQGALLMVERRRGLTYMTHAILAIGVFILAFPIYVAFVASTRLDP
jgi:hypothetical protein